MSYLYIIKVEDRVKIGISKNIDSRFKNLEMQGGFRIKEKFVYKCIDSKCTESYLHKYFDKYRGVGEYFENIDIKDIIDYLEANKNFLLTISRHSYKFNGNINTGEEISIKQGTLEWQTYLLKKLGGEKKLGFAYLGYLQVLINTVDYSNKIDFNVYRSYGISDAMIKSLRKKFKEVGLVKNIGRDFYINPSVARKGQEIPMYVLELFKN